MKSERSSFLAFFWTLFGPYARDRMGPLGNGPTWNINSLRRLGSLSPAGNLLEVLAGAISWGFKSPLRTTLAPVNLMSTLGAFGGEPIDVIRQAQAWSRGSSGPSTI